jgi:hypothetical protein
MKDEEQVPIRPVTVRAIMSRPTFELGAADIRAGRPYHRHYDLWDTNGQWDYERGRAWGLLAPHHVQLKLKRNGKVTNEAVRWFDLKFII